MSTNSNRIDWVSYAMGLAWMASQRSEARSIGPDGSEASRKVGACILAKDNNRVLSLGYNGFLPGFKPPIDFYKDPVKRSTHIIHAETNALVNVRRGEAGIIALTRAPCATCAQQIVARQIPVVAYGEPYSNTEGIDILRFFGTNVLYSPLIRIMEDWIVPAVEDFLASASSSENNDADATPEPAVPTPS
jgi:deoxycytidylate deaminase